MIFLYSHWLRLPIATRHALAHVFNINKKNPTHVIDNVVRDDGYVIGDIESALTATAMSAYTGLPYENAEQLWNDVVAKAEGRAAVRFTEGPEPVTEKQLDAAIKELVKEEKVLNVENKVPAPTKPIKKVIKKK